MVKTRKKILGKKDCIHFIFNLPKLTEKRKRALIKRKISKMIPFAERYEIDYRDFGKKTIAILAENTDEEDSNQQYVSPVFERIFSLNGIEKRMLLCDSEFSALNQATICEDELCKIMSKYNINGKSRRRSSRKSLVFLKKWTCRLNSKTVAFLFGLMIVICLLALSKFYEYKKIESQKFCYEKKCAELKTEIKSRLNNDFGASFNFQKYISPYNMLQFLGQELPDVKIQSVTSRLNRCTVNGSGKNIVPKLEKLDEKPFVAEAKMQKVMIESENAIFTEMLLFKEVDNDH